MNKEKLLEINKIWQEIQEETRLRADAEPVLASFFHSTILEHSSFSSAIANQLANDLANVSVQPMMLRNVIKDALNSDPKILENITLDLIAVKERDPACKYFSSPLLLMVIDV